ncbi:MAG: uracil-DNA glycosylase [Pseudomonadota bacterium]
MMTSSKIYDQATDPHRDCALCDRLVAFRTHYRTAEPEWFNAPVPTFRDGNPKLLIIGLAPGLRGANRSGRPFTGDYAGDLLYETLDRFGFSSGRYAARPDDGLRLIDAAITNAVRCVPPENKPTGPEIKACRPFLQNTLAEMKDLRALVVLGRIAHDTTLTTLGLRRAAYPFAHGAEHDVGPDLMLFDSYHCSRYNTNTGRLTPSMFHAVFQRVAEHLSDAQAA